MAKIENRYSAVATKVFPPPFSLQPNKCKTTITTTTTKQNTSAPAQRSWASVSNIAAPAPVVVAAAKAGPAVNAAQPTAAAPAQSSQKKKAPEQPQQQPAAQKKEKEKGAKGGSDPNAFSNWCENELKAVTTCDIQTLISFLVVLDNPKDICDYIGEYLGKSKEVDAKRFAEAFIRRRNQEGTLRGAFAPEMWRVSATESKKVTRL